MQPLVVAQVTAAVALAVSLAALFMVAEQIARLDATIIQLNSVPVKPSVVPNAPPISRIDPPIIDGDPSSDNKFFGGVDWCTSVPGIHVPPQKWALNHGQTLCPAITTYGATLMNGDLFVTGSIVMLLDSDTPTFINLTKFFIDYNNINSDVCDHKCFNGGTFIPSSCSCVCTDLYIGDDCSTPTCAPYGHYDPGVAKCICNLPVPPEIHIDAYCKAIQVADFVDDTDTPTCIGCFGTCAIIDGESTCLCLNDGELGPNCEYRCATKTIDNTQCAPRNNWGIDGCYQLDNGLWSCVCGGGYTWLTADTVEISAMQCTTAECKTTFENYAHICCAPGINCYQTECTTTDASCCIEYAHTEIGCIAAGCTFCASTDNVTGLSQTTCAATAFVSASAFDRGACTAISPYNVSGAWTTWQYDCSTTNTTDVCDRATRDTYLEIYNTACTNNTVTLDCLRAARTVVNSQPWPRLTIDVGYRENVLYHAALFSPRGYTDTLALRYSVAETLTAPVYCILDHYVHTYEATLGVFVTDMGLSRQPADFKCLQNFYVITTTLENGDVGYYAFFLSTQSAYRYCLAKRELRTRAKLIEYFGVDTLHVDTQVWRQLYNTETGSYKDYLQYCDPSPVGDYTFGVTLMVQHAVFGVSNYGTNTLLTAVSSVNVQRNVLATPSYVDVPYMPIICPVACRTLGDCRATDVACLQTKNNNTGLTWTACCFCMWKHYSNTIQCF